MSIDQSESSASAFLGFGPGGVKLSTELAPPDHGLAQQFFAYCEARRGDQPVLRRAQVQPRDVVALLPNLFIAEESDGDWLYRLAGGNILLRAGVEFTGKRLREICEPDSAAAARRLYDSVARRLQPACVRNSYHALGSQRVIFEAAQVPMLAHDGETIQIFGGMFFF